MLAVLAIVYVPKSFLIDMSQAASMSKTCPRHGDACWMRLRTERLFVQGFRKILMGYEDRDSAHWDEAWNHFAKELGYSGGRHALEAIWDFTNIFRRGALCPLGYHVETCPFLCKSECLALSLMAAIQEQDRQSAHKCALNLFKSSHLNDAETSAFRVTVDFVALGLRFVPVPGSVVDDILTRSALVEGASPEVTVH